jgi:two-component system chemotaxis sensor kinase CheA
MDTGIFIDDFIVEARAHIEKLEASFLDMCANENNPKTSKGLLRTAHSLKGTASFFTLEKIVAVSHELESAFTHIIEDGFAINDDVAEIVLRSVDCLKELVENIENDDKISIGSIISDLQKLNTQVSEKKPAALQEAETSYNVSNPDIINRLRNAARHGHQIYRLSIGLGSASFINTRKICWTTSCPLAKYIR